MGKILILLLAIKLFAFDIYSNWSGEIPQKYALKKCGGENISPSITLKNLPKNTKSIAITIFDIDVPWLHWAIFNLNKKIPENIKPNQYLQLKNSYGFFGYGGPCPPSGVHRYVLSVYALKQKVHFSKNTPIKKALQIIKPLIIEKREIIGRFKHKSNFWDFFR